LAGVAPISEKLIALVKHRNAILQGYFFSICETNPKDSQSIDSGYKYILLKKFTFRSQILHFSHSIKDSMQARNPQSETTQNI